jgi:hypothetical protein
VPNLTLEYDIVIEFVINEELFNDMYYLYTLEYDIVIEFVINEELFNDMYYLKMNID